MGKLEFYFAKIMLCAILVISSSSIEADYASDFESIKNRFNTIVDSGLKGIDANEAWTIINKNLSDFQALEEKVDSAPNVASVLPDMADGLESMADSYEQVANIGKEALSQMDSKRDELRSLIDDAVRIRVRIEDEIDDKNKEIGDLEATNLKSSTTDNDRVKNKAKIQGLEKEIGTLERYIVQTNALISFLNNYVGKYTDYYDDLDLLFTKLEVTASTYRYSADFARSQATFPQYNDIDLDFDVAEFDLENVLEDLDDIEDQIDDISIG